MLVYFVLWIPNVDHKSWRLWLTLYHYTNHHGICFSIENKRWEKNYSFSLWKGKRLRLRLVRVKAFSENIYFSEMLFSGKENVFMCLVAFQKNFWKIFSDVWLYSWKYHRKHIFYLLLTFSHIFSATKQTPNVIHS